MGYHPCWVPNSRPDEEGIETCPRVHGTYGYVFQTADLMKKGLRLMPEGKRLRYPFPNSRPDEEGIETYRANLPSDLVISKQQT